ncbi:MAG TPA: MATE family efflux transporter [Clostridiales bacterium]|nr:MATE family efflux transporter [Clostridiales bacterium]
MQILPDRDKNFLRSLIVLALPISIQNLINSSLNMVDTLMLGALGEIEIAASSVANALFFIIMLVVFGISSGSSVLVSQYWGKKDVRSIQRIFGISLILSSGIAFVISLLIFLFPETVVSIVTDKSELIGPSAGYARIVAFSNLFGAAATVYIGTLRCMENARFGMYVHSAGILTNTLLNWIMIFGKLGFPALGLKGAAIATLIARMLEFLVCTLHAASRKKKYAILSRESFRPGRLLFQDYLRYSLPVIVNESLWGVGYSLLSVIYGHMGTLAVAAASIAVSIERILGATVFGIASAAIVLVGKEIGAGNLENGRQNAHFLLRLSFFYGGVLGIILMLSRPLVLSLFNLSPDTLQAAAAILGVMALVMPARSFNATLIVGVLRGGGDVHFALFADVSGIWLLSVPLLAFAGLVLKLPVAVTYAFIAFEEVYRVALGLWRMKSGKWIRPVTREADGTVSAL